MNNANANSRCSYRGWTQMKTNYFLVIPLFLLIEALVLCALIAGCHGDGHDATSSDDSGCTPVDRSCLNRPCCLGLLTVEGLDERYGPWCVCYSYSEICEEMATKAPECRIDFSFQCPQDGEIYFDCYSYAASLECPMFQDCLANNSTNMRL